MALRVSAMHTATEIDLQAVNGDADGAAVGIEFGPELMRFAESVASRDEALERRRRELLEAAGPAVLVDAAGVAANFQRMTRIADAMGIPRGQHGLRDGAAGAGGTGHRAVSECGELRPGLTGPRLGLARLRVPVRLSSGATVRRPAITSRPPPRSARSRCGGPPLRCARPRRGAGAPSTPARPIRTLPGGSRSRLRPFRMSA